MKSNKLEVGLRIKVFRLGKTKGMFVKKEHLDVRKIGITGTLLDYVPGHGGDVWWVKHDDGKIGAYVFNELKKI
jgi:hypothetical protein